MEILGREGTEEVKNQLNPGPKGPLRPAVCQGGKKISVGDVGGDGEGSGSAGGTLIESPSAGWGEKKKVGLLWESYF